MIILGINEGHCSTATLLRDGEIVACISEERLSRRKNQSGFPVKSVKECLDLAGLKPGDVDQMLLSSSQAPPLVLDVEGYSSWSTAHRTKHWFTHLAGLRDCFKGSKNFDLAVARFFGPIVGRRTCKQRIEVASKQSGIPPSKIDFVDHHVAHGMSAIFGSGWAKDDLLVLTVDGEGDLLSATVGTWKGGQYNIIARSYFTDSPGHFYTGVTALLGMKRLEHEYKVMGLAPYATGPEVEVVRELLSHEIGFDTNTLTFWSKVHSHRFEQHLEKVLYRKRFDYIAAGTQLHLENMLCQMVEASVKRTGINSVVAAGGSFMNVKANLSITRLPCVRRFFVTPSCGDESLGIGACYYGHHRSAGGKLPAPIRDLYLGREPDIAGIDEKAAKLGFTVERTDALPRRVAELLARGEIVGRCAGRMEFGARALGNRSILADPTAPDVVERINRAIKHRDFWMPFAPVVDAAHAADYIDEPALLDKSVATFMMMAYDTTPRGKKDLQGGLHPYDKSIRAQVLTPQHNPGYYAILSEFGKLTGRHGLLNTSFNIHGFPIVSTADEALDVLVQSGLDHLIIGPVLIHKKTS